MKACTLAAGCRRIKAVQLPGDSRSNLSVFSRARRVSLESVEVNVVEQLAGLHRTSLDPALLG